jgi:hypothetical protein
MGFFLKSLHVFSFLAGSIVVTTNRALRNCKIILTNDNTLAPAMIDRLVHRRWLVQTKGAI